MARSEAVPLLLLPLLLASAVGYEYYRLDQVSLPPWAPARTNNTDNCAGVCDAEPFCSGYQRAPDGTCHIYSVDCRGPAINSSQLLANDICYMAINKCPGTALAPCGCPDGFRRYGSRCLHVSLEPAANHDAAWTTCLNMGAHPAIPRSETEHDQFKLAVADATSGSPQPVWIGIEDRADGVWLGSDHCGPISQPFWAVGQPDNTVVKQLRFGAYVPPGVPNMAPGWHSRAPSDGPYRVVCQLLFCHRPECAN